MADEQIIIEVIVDNNQATKNIEKQTRNVVALENQIKSLQTTQTQLNKQGKRNSAVFRENNELIALNKEELKSANRSRQDSIKTIGLVNNSLNAQKAALAANKKAIGNVNTATRQGAKDYKRLNTEILKQTKSLKKAEQAQGTFTRGVGDYGQALGKVNPALGGFISSIQGATKASLAFIATPLGLVLAAVALALGSVAAFFTRTEEGGDKLAVVTATLSGVFESLLDVLSTIGSLIVDQVIAGFEQGAISFEILAATFERGILNIELAYASLFGTQEEANAINKELQENTKRLALAETEMMLSVQASNAAFEDSVGAIGDSIASIDDKIAANQKLARSERALQKTIIDETTLNAERNRQIFEGLKIGKDERLSFDERRKGFELAGKAEQALADSRVKIAEEEFRIAQIRFDIHDSTLEDRQELATSEAAVTEARTQSLRTQTKIQAAQITLLNQEKAIKTKADNDAIKSSEARAQAELDRLEKERQAAFDLDIFKRELAAAELTDAQARADALVAIEQDKSARLLENERLTASEGLLIEAESLQAQKELQAQANAQANEDQAVSDQETEEGDKALSAAKIGLASQTFDAVGLFAEEGSTLAKAAAIGNATINTFQAITNSLANVPAPFNIASAAITGALGFAQVANIAGIFEDGGINMFENGGMNDYAQGGVGKGARHSGGGIQMFSKGGRHTGEFEGGEAIISRRATAMFKPQLSAMNVAGGGKSFAHGGVNLATSSTAGIDSAMASELSIGNQLSNQSPVQVAVTDINRTQDNVSVKQNRATI